MNRRSFFAALALLPAAVKVMLSGPRISAAELKAPARWFDASDRMPYDYSTPRESLDLWEERWNEIWDSSTPQPNMIYVSEKTYDWIQKRLAR